MTLILSLIGCGGIGSVAVIDYLDKSVSKQR
jgi:hypothetical protein